MSKSFYSHFRFLKSDLKAWYNHLKTVEYCSYSKVDKVFSFDAETNGLWGEPFSIGAVVTERGIPVAEFIGTCPIQGEVNQWVAENVVPQCGEITHPNLYSLLVDFGKFYHKHREGAVFIAHMGYIVEAYLLRLMRQHNIIGEWEAPYPLHDVASIIYGAEIPYDDDRKRLDPVSIDTSLKYYKSSPSEYYEKIYKAYEKATAKIAGKTHNPLWDSYQAAEMFAYMTKIV
jgi:hypothetical protein